MDKKSILLNEIINIPTSERGQWSFCLNHATWDGVCSFSDNPERMLEHISWKKSVNKKVSFRNINTKYCLQFLGLESNGKRDQWLFLGAFENFGVFTTKNGDERYDLKPIDKFSSLRERLIIEYKKHPGDKQAKISIEFLDEIKVIKVLDKIYVNVDKEFSGYDNVTLSFKDLKALIDHDVDNWRSLLSNIQCIYVITDNLTGKLYIGSTYGYDGVWQRWSCYASTGGHGGDKELKALIDKDPNYGKNFTFSIIESFLNTDLVNPEKIRQREQYWKHVFDTVRHGYNDNY